MATRLPTASQNSACDAIVDRTDVGGAGSIEVRTAPQPATANLAATGTLLVTFTLPNPAFGASASGVATLLGVPISAVGVAAGTAAWFRMLSGGGATVLDGAATVTGGGGELELNSTTISIGVGVDITAGTVTMPAA